jgi:hypothetical protein
MESIIASALSSFSVPFGASHQRRKMKSPKHKISPRIAFLVFFIRSLLWPAVVLGNDSAAAGGSLLNAYLSASNSVMDAMLPNNFYFFEFPTEEAYLSGANLPPMCADGSPYSFLFRRGSNEHYQKLMVELEGGPACWKTNGCGCDKHARNPPWHDYKQTYLLQESSAGGEKALPWIGSCHGVVPAFVQELTPLLFRNSSSSTTTTTTDIPISIRDNSNNNGWWEALKSQDDWSYLLLPHCSMDWHLGYQAQGRWSGCQMEDQPFDGPFWEAPVWQGEERIWHRGGANMEAVLDWLTNQFSSSGAGLDALVTFSGGRIGGCDDPESASSIASALFATEAAKMLDVEPSSMLVVLDGPSIQNENLPSNSVLESQWNPKALTQSSIMDDVKQVIANAPQAVEFAWIASEQANSNTVEKEMLIEMAQQKPGQFHVFIPQGFSKESLGSCPRFAFPDNGDDYTDFASFLQDVASDMSWKTSASQQHSNADLLPTANNSDVSRLSFLSIAVLMLGLLALAWLIYFGIKSYCTKHDLPPPPSPKELWLNALTHYPFWFLVASVTLPVTLSLIAFARSGYMINVNLDFESYLDISSDLDIVANNYASAQQYQRDSSAEATDQCRAVAGDGNGRLLLGPAPGVFSMLPEGGENDRKLEDMAYAALTIIYQNRNGGNVFTREVLESIYDFEQSVRDFPDFTKYCRLKDEECGPFNSVLSYLYPDEELVDDIEQVLFAETKSSQVDQYFSRDNLQSNITQSIMYFQGKQRDMDQFLESLYRDLLWERDQNDFYPDMIYTWENGYLQRLEANDALYHDILWSIGSLVVIGAMILLKVQDVFEFFFGILGLLLAFTTSYYWCMNHFDIPEITLLHVAGLFVMLGIGADDIFLMIDSYEHAKVALEQGGLDGDEDGLNEDDHPINLERIRSRMLWAYSTAGGMMLVSSLTAAVCFFSNAFGVLLVIQEFGIYMGMVVLINFLHVMTILPSAILVNDVYIKPWKKRCFGCILDNCRAKNGERRTTKLDSDLGMFQSNLGEVEDDSANNSQNICAITDDLVAANETSEDEVEMILEPLPRSQDSDQTENASGRTAAYRMNRTDSWLLGRYAPFLIRRRVSILVVSVMFASLLGIFGILNLEFTDGSIVIFSDDYNQGRLSSIQVRQWICFVMQCFFPDQQPPLTKRLILVYTII